MQEIAHFVININSSEYTDIVLEGDSWMDTQLQVCSRDVVTNTCKYHLQQEIRVGIRDDTGKPNGSPLVLYKPVYRVRLNEVTRIPIIVADNDGDIPRCRPARFVELSFIRPIMGTNITRDCVVIVSAFESDGFNDGDWGIVNMIVEDVPIDTINMGGFIYQGKMDTLGQTQVQFLIQTLANLTNPEFVAPTPCVNGTEAHVPSYYMYSGTTLRLPLHAQASTENFVDVDIERFHITSMPIQNLSLAPPTPAPGRPLTDNVWMTQLSWKLDVHESAHYLLQAIAVDTRGFDSLDCSFDVQVEVVNYTKQPSKVGPYFPYFPDPGAVSCLQDAICSLPIYANTDDPTANITNIEITSSSAELGNPTALWVGPSTFMNESLYQADITFSSSQTGDKQLCVRATDSYG
ncbi:hypothetical protein RRG08_026120 [Elysia crispata]|uniref:Uncharacterized protein n=1 Tax=Elysia crispata TaxID=231223 RepID=A0AAE1D3T4_9GAST|nr:hypothetical protein RRG08_026120 [Elysia crispata]